MAVEVAQRSRGGGGGGGNPLGGGRAAKSHGEEIVAIIYSILLTYSASSSHFFAVANEISFVRSRRAVPLLVFLVLVLVALRCCVKIARCPPRREHPQHFLHCRQKILVGIPHALLLLCGQSLGNLYSPWPCILPKNLRLRWSRSKELVPTCVAAGLTLRLTHMAYRQK